jgi:probable rRNA maturation factor
MKNIHVVFQEKVNIDKKIIINSAQAVLKHQYGTQATAYELTIVVTNDEQIKVLNKQFRGIDTATDVLSFPADEVDPDDEKKYIGDIILSFPTAEKQSRGSGHILEDEIKLLVVHGVLHLMGFDHDSTTKKTEMWNAQKYILTQLNVNVDLFNGLE